MNRRDRSRVTRVIVFSALLLTCASSSHGEDRGAGGEVTVRTLLGNAADYGYMWWTNGLRDERKTFSIQTSQYALQLDVPRLALTHLQRITDPPGASVAITQRNADTFGTANASLRLELEAGGNTFEAIGASPRFENCHLLESGRFFQRRLIKGIRWPARAPRVAAECEVAAWPDRLTLLLRVTPSELLQDSALRLVLQAADDWVVEATPPRAVVSRSNSTEGWTVQLDVGNWSAGEERTVAMVLMPERVPETRPIIAAHQIAPRETPLEVLYDPTMGWHHVGLRNDPPARTYHESSNQRIERVKLSLSNPAATEQAIRLNFAKGLPGPGGVFGITGLSAVLRDADGDPTGIPIQISKNWHAGKPSFVTGPWKPERYRGSWYRGLTMFTLPPRTTVELEYTSVNAFWGTVPAASLAQLCLVGWGSNQLWEQSAIGSWGESLCLEIDQGQRGGAVLDTRPLMVSGMGEQPRHKWGWTCNVGGADFLVYYDRDGQKQWNSRMKSRHRRNGPVLTELIHAGRSHDAKIDVRYTASIYRTDDIARGVYRFRYDVREPVAFRRLVLFQSGGDDYSYTGERKFARGDKTGLIQEWPTQWGGNAYRTKPVKVAELPAWFSMHEAVARREGKEAWANRGIIIRHWDARLGGREVQPWAAERGANVRGVDTSLIDVLPPPDIDRLEVGDYVEAAVEHVIVPQTAADYYGPNASLRSALEKWQDTWRMIHREAVGNDLDVGVTRGDLVRVRPTMIRAVQDRAEFSITGGLGYVPVTICGLTDHRSPVLQVKQGDTWSTIDQARHGKDYWQTDFDPESATWQVTYSVPLDTPGDRRLLKQFRFQMGDSPSVSSW